jgi:DNA polymerase
VARGYPFSDLKKDRVAKALADYTWSMDEAAVRVLELRQQAARTSIKKYVAMQNVHVRGRLRGAFQFMGASRTGRWAGRVVQLQNLPRPDKALEDFMLEVREMIDAKDLELIHTIFDRPMNALAASIRSAIKAPHGHKLIVADLSAIESRVLGWVAGCETLLDVFRRGLDTYKAFAVYLFHKPYEEITKAERDLSKPAMLGAGYRLGGGNEVGEYPDVKKTGLWGYGESMGIKMSQEEALYAVNVFREVYLEIVQLWYDLERAVFEAMRTQAPQRVGMLQIDIKPPFLRIRLPSGRYLHYLRPRIENVTMKTKDGPVQRKNLTYEGYDLKNNWTRLSTHGGKLTENIVQAIARDILAVGIANAKKAGFSIVGHVHDEIIALEPEHTMLTVEDLEHCMTDMPAWANLPLRAEGYEATVYRK